MLYAYEVKGMLLQLQVVALNGECSEAVEKTLKLPIMEVWYQFKETL